jgi:DNA-binding response OmpR family regulator
MHRGQVEVQSHLGEGSEFIIKLPLILSPSQVPVVAVTDVAPQTVRSLKVLVVDDNIDAARSVAMLLRISGQDSRLAHDGGSAMKTALDYVTDVVLLDIGLPVADCFQVAKWIRQQDALQNVVLVALTGYGRETDRQLSREAGFDHHLVKPVEMANIESILSNVAMNIH